MENTKTLLNLWMDFADDPSEITFISSNLSLGQQETRLLYNYINQNSS